MCALEIKGQVQDKNTTRQLMCEQAKKKSGRKRHNVTAGPSGCVLLSPGSSRLLGVGRSGLTDLQAS